MANFMLGLSAGIAFICCWAAWQEGVAPGKRRFWIPFAIAFGLNGWRRVMAVPDEESMIDAAVLLAVSLLWLAAILIYRYDHR